MLQEEQEALWNPQPGQGAGGAGHWEWVLALSARRVAGGDALSEGGVSSREAMCRGFGISAAFPAPFPAPELHMELGASWGAGAWCRQEFQ